MASVRRRPLSRAGAFVSALLFALVGTAVVASPANAVDPSVPVWSIKSIGDTVATRDTLTVEKVVLEVGYTGTQEIRFRFELDNCCESGTPARFLGGQADKACNAIGATPTTTMECAYTREIPAPRDEEFAFGFPISRPAPTGYPSVKMTVFVGGGSMSRWLNAKRVKPEADFVVTSGGPVQGRVGDIVEFEWTLTNVGLDPVWSRNGMITLTAPRRHRVHGDRVHR